MTGREGEQCLFPSTQSKRVPPQNTPTLYVGKFLSHRRLTWNDERPHFVDFGQSLHNEYEAEFIHSLDLINSFIPSFILLLTQKVAVSLFCLDTAASSPTSFPTASLTI